MGQEKTPEEYIESLAGVFKLVKKILKPEGSLWINMGDRYLKKDLMGLPWKLVLKLKEQGWILRNSCIWYKPNAMPVSVKDRLNQDYEFLFHLVKNRSYYYNLDNVRIPHITKFKRDYTQKKTVPAFPSLNSNSSRLHSSKMLPVQKKHNPKRQPGHPHSNAYHPLGKNPGSLVVAVTSRNGKGHPASFPPLLCRTPILTTCPPGGIVLDPFAGIGSSLLMAKRLGRNFTGIELNPLYANNTGIL